MYLILILLLSSLIWLLQRDVIYLIYTPNPTLRNIIISKNYLEVLMEEYHSFFWQINIFSLTSPRSLPSFRQPHLIPLPMVAMASTKYADSRITAYPLGRRMRSISSRTYFISHLQKNVNSSSKN